MQRKFNRDHLRRQVGNKGLASAWNSFQRRRYGKNYDLVCKPGGR